MAERSSYLAPGAPFRCPVCRTQPMTRATRLPNRRQATSQPVRRSLPASIAARSATACARAGDSSESGAPLIEYGHPAHAAPPRQCFSRGAAGPSRAPGR